MAGPALTARRGTPRPAAAALPPPPSALRPPPPAAQGPRRPPAQALALAVGAGAQLGAAGRKRCGPTSGPRSSGPSGPPRSGSALRASGGLPASGPPTARARGPRLLLCGSRPRGARRPTPPTPPPAWAAAPSAPGAGTPAPPAPAWPALRPPGSLCLPAVNVHSPKSSDGPPGEATAVRAFTELPASGADGRLWTLRRSAGLRNELGDQEPSAGRPR